MKYAKGLSFMNGMNARFVLRGNPLLRAGGRVRTSNWRPNDDICIHNMESVLMRQAEWLKTAKAGPTRLPAGTVVRLRDGHEILGPLRRYPLQSLHQRSITTG
jgi:hypothetical protein